MLLPATVALPRLSAGVSVISYNVLLPNAADGWWLYKYYDGATPIASTQWPARSALLSDRLLGSAADVVMLQECSAESFETDWAFLTEAGYDHALYSKGRMRPATFWKRERLTLCDAAGALLEATDTSASKLEGDRTLTTHLRLIGDESLPPFHIVNVHLSAGQESRRRLRQVHETLEAIRKARAKLAKAPPPPCVVLGGDFNSQGLSGVRRLLEAGEVLPDFRDPTESGQEMNEVTSKAKRQSLGAFADAMALA